MMMMMMVIIMTMTMTMMTFQYDESCGRLKETDTVVMKTQSNTESIVSNWRKLTWKSYQLWWWQQWWGQRWWSWWWYWGGRGYDYEDAIEDGKHCQQLSKTDLEIIFIVMIMTRLIISMIMDIMTMRREEYDRNIGEKLWWWTLYSIHNQIASLIYRMLIKSIREWLWWWCRW